MPLPPLGPKMANGVWKGVYPYIFGRSKQHLLNKFFDPSTPSMRKGRDGGKTGKKNGGEKKTGEKKKRQVIIVTTTSLPAVDRPNADRWNAARSCQKFPVTLWDQSCIVFRQVLVISLIYGKFSDRRVPFVQQVLN